MLNVYLKIRIYNYKDFLKILNMKINFLNQALNMRIDSSWLSFPIFILTFQNCKEVIEILVSMVFHLSFQNNDTAYYNII